MQESGRGDTSICFGTYGTSGTNKQVHVLFIMPLISQGEIAEARYSSNIYKGLWRENGGKNFST